MLVTAPSPLRSAAATAVLLSGVAQVAMLWVLDLGAPVLLTALCGFVYLLIALGLYGVSRLALGLAAVACALRAGSGYNPLPVESWEQLRTLTDLVVAVTAVTLLWRARRVATH